MGMTRSFGLPAAICCFTLIWSGAAFARDAADADTKAAPETKVEKKVETKAETKIESKEGEKAAPEKEEPKKTGFPGLEIDIEKKSVTATGKVCLTKGIVEYLIVAGGGKEYESVLSMDAKPSHLHAALLMVGGQVGKVAEELMGDDKAKAKDKPDKAASLFTMNVEWIDDGKKVSFPGEMLLHDREKKTTGRDLAWAFTGSMFYKLEDGRERYLADEDGSIVATYYDDGAILNLAVQSKDPYRGSSFGYEVNEKRIPPKGTTVLITFALKKKE
ncbi:YdjY domain-containing protein [Planctomycetota bacterium]